MKDIYIAQLLNFCKYNDIRSIFSILIQFCFENKTTEMRQYKEKIKNSFIPSKEGYVHCDNSNTIYLIRKLHVNKHFTLSFSYPILVLPELKYEQIENEDDYQEEGPEDYILYETYEDFDANSTIKIKIDDIILIEIPLFMMPETYLIYDFMTKLFIYIEKKVENHIMNVYHPDFFSNLRLYNSMLENVEDDIHHSIENNIEK